MKRAARSAVWTGLAPKKNDGCGDAGIPVFLLCRTLSGVLHISASTEHSSAHKMQKDKFLNCPRKRGG